MRNTDGVEEEIERINKALGEDSKYKCVELSKGYVVEKKR